MTESGGASGGGGAGSATPSAGPKGETTGTAASSTPNEGARAPTPIPLERLEFDRYDGPKSHHASRAFAEMQARTRRRRRKKKIAIVIAVLVLGACILWAATASLLHFLSS